MWLTFMGLLADGTPPDWTQFGIGGLLAAGIIAYLLKENASLKKKEDENTKQLLSLIEKLAPLLREANKLYRRSTEQTTRAIDTVSRRQPATKEVDELINSMRELRDRLDDRES